MKTQLKTVVVTLGTVIGFNHPAFAVGLAIAFCMCYIGYILCRSIPSEHSDLTVTLIVIIYSALFPIGIMIIALDTNCRETFRSDMAELKKYLGINKYRIVFQTPIKVIKICESNPTP